MKAHTTLPISLCAALALAGAASADIFGSGGLATVPEKPAPAPEPVVEVEVETPPPVAVPTVPAVPVAVPTVPVAVPAVPTVPVAVPAVPTVPVAVPAIPVAVPAVPVAAPGKQTVAVPESQVLGPTPEESSDPKRLLHAFCQAWKDENWKKVWYCMEPSFRKSHAFESFQKRFEDDNEMTGGLDDETIAANPKIQGVRQTFDVTLNFQNAPMVKPRKVKAVLKTTPDGYRVVESTILPADLNDM